MVATGDGPGGIRVGLIALGIAVLFPLLVLLVALPILGGLGVWQGPGQGLSPLAGFAIAGFSLLVLGAVGRLLYRSLTGAANRRTRAMEDLQFAHAQGEVSDEEFEELKARIEAADSETGDGE